jgi:hypothetical protein
LHAEAEREAPVGVVGVDAVGDAVRDVDPAGAAYRQVEEVVIRAWAR